MKAICCIAKNEELYINDWIKYHIELGFDRIYIYDNNDIDKPLTKDKIDYLYADKVTIIDYRGLKQVQLKAYQDFFKNECFKYEWCAVIDCDEFISIKDKSLDAYLNQYSDIDIIKLCWRVYTDDNKITDDLSIPVYERFFTTTNNQIYKSCPGFMIKCILNTSRKQKYDWSHSCHRPVEYSFKQILSDGTFIKEMHAYVSEFTDDAIIKHYMTKSLDEFLNQKFNRTDARWNIVEGLSYYFRVNEKTEEKINYLKNKGIEV